jgi:hypothetical protein
METHDRLAIVSTRDTAAPVSTADARCRIRSAASRRVFIFTGKVSSARS